MLAEGDTATVQNPSTLSHIPHPTPSQSLGASWNNIFAAAQVKPDSTQHSSISDNASSHPSYNPATSPVFRSQQYHTGLRTCSGSGFQVGGFGSRIASLMSICLPLKTHLSLNCFCWTGVLPRNYQPANPKVFQKSPALPGGLRPPPTARAAPRERAPKESFGAPGPGPGRGS